MPINDLTTFCNTFYFRRGQCDDCPNGEQCRGNCETCLSDIHANNISRRYNCNNIIYYYVCKHIYRYASEVEYLLDQVTGIDELRKFRIISVGCGPCSELFGFLNYLQKRDDDRKIIFLGFDLNEIWEIIHSKIEDIAEKTEPIKRVRFYTKDIFELFDKIKKGDGLPVNIIFLNYLFSDMTANGYDVTEFIDNLENLIFKKMPKNSYILVNDINHNTLARNYFDYMYDLLRRKYRISTVKYHFHNPNRPFVYSYGRKHSENTIKTEIPRELEKYNPWKYCASAQMAIQKKV